MIFLCEILVYVLSFILVGCSQLFAMDESKHIEAARALVEKFCRAEFMGVQDIRLDIAKYSHKQMTWENKRDPEFRGMVKDWDNDPLMVVASFEMTALFVKNNHARATVVYERLARTEGDGVLNRQLIPDRLAHDTVDLQLIYEGATWWIFDPPLPRVSLDALIKYYKETLRRLGSNWLERTDISEGQKQYYRKDQENLQILNSLQQKLN